MPESSMLYRKVGRRYREVGPEFSGWPAPGVWLVQDGPGGKRSSLIAKLGELPDPVDFAAFASHIEVIANAIVEVWKREKWSPMAMAEAIVQAVYARRRA